MLRKVWLGSLVWLAVGFSCLAATPQCPPETVCFTIDEAARIAQTLAEAQRLKQEEKYLHPFITPYWQVGITKDPINSVGGVWADLGVRIKSLSLAVGVGEFSGSAGVHVSAVWTHSFVPKIHPKP